MDGGVCVGGARQRENVDGGEGTEEGESNI